MKARTVKSGRYLYTPDAPRRFIRCQHCGFICDTTRDTNRANQTTFSDVTYVICIENRYEELITDEHGNEILTELDSMPVKTEGVIECMENGYEELIILTELDSMPVELETGAMPGFFEVSSGCPFCGAEYTKPFRI